MSALALPFLSLPDPVVSGEGALDPLGLAAIGDQLAEWTLPGLRARMSRPRFLTAIAVAAVVCEGLEEAVAADGVTPAHLVFEWLLVEGFAREGVADDTARTPGSLKAREAVRAGARMSARSYLKVPSVFGFHGVYKRLAANVGIVDDDFSLRENGHALIKVWQEEQQLEGFADSSDSRRAAASFRRLLRAAVEDGLAHGHTARGAGWQGWRFLAERLAPGRTGAREAEFIRRLLLDPQAGRREEVFGLLSRPDNLRVADEGSEAAVVRHLLPQASAELAHRLRAAAAFESFCALVEDAFDWLRHLSTRSRSRALPRSEFSSAPGAREAAAALAPRLSAVEELLDEAPRQAREKFDELSPYFAHVRTADEICDAALRRHASVQKGKPPEGKREWFEHAADGGLYVRPAYRLDAAPAPRDWWPRPYRLHTVRNFCHDLEAPLT